RIHRSNLIGMGVLPLQFMEGESAESLGLTGRETFDIGGLADAVVGRTANDRTIEVEATRDDGTTLSFRTLVRIDTPQEAEYYKHGGILHYVLRQLVGTPARA